MKKIEALTPLQEQDLISFRSEWLKIGLSTEILNKTECERVIGDFYQRIGKQSPIFWYFDSPLSCQLKIGRASCRERV